MTRDFYGRAGEQMARRPLVQRCLGYKARSAQKLRTECGNRRPNRICSIIAPTIAEWFWLGGLNHSGIYAHWPGGCAMLQNYMARNGRA
jgi:hypothetical protein